MDGSAPYKIGEYRGILSHVCTTAPHGPGSVDKPRGCMESVVCLGVHSLKKTGCWTPVTSVIRVGQIDCYNTKNLLGVFAGLIRKPKIMFCINKSQLYKYYLRDDVLN